MNELLRLDFDRRRFLQAALATGAATMLPEFLRTGVARAATPVGANEGIVVLIMLGGGNDGLNTVAPASSSRYQTLRGSLALDPATVHPVGNGLGLHPSLVNVARRFDQGSVAIVQGVDYPNPNLSHFDAMGDWMTGWGGSGFPGTGWIGRWLDGLAVPDSLRAVAIGGNVPPHLRGASWSGVSLPDDMGSAFGIDRSDRWTANLVDLVGSYSAIGSARGAWGQQLGTLGRTTIDLGGRVAPAYSGLSGSGIARDLALAAKLINADVGIRVFSVELDGFDTHQGQASAHSALLADLDTGIEAFFTSLDPRWSSRVTLMTFSEFGRRPEANGSGGTDHGTAAPLFVIGQGVRGGLHSTAPSLTALDSNDNFVATCDFHQVYASILGGWLAADPDPILGRHYQPFDLFKWGPGGPAANSGGSGRSSGGYWTVTSGGRVRGFGDAAAMGDAPVGADVVGITATNDRGGYWLVTADGTVYPQGNATNFGDMHGRRMAAPVVDMAATPSGQGYWLLGRDGGVFSFGDAQFFGSTGAMHLVSPVVGLAPCPMGGGYWLVAGDGGIFAFGPGAQFYGSTGALRLAAPVVAMAPTSTGDGYWLVASDGGVFCFGDAVFQGSTGGIHLNRPVIGITPTGSGRGYWLVASDGGVFAFGDAPFVGSAVDDGAEVVAIA